MPELPEVETIRATIEPRVVGRRVLGVRVGERRLRRPIAPDFEQRLLGRRIEAVRRRAKYLLLDVGDGLRWVVHLGMSGRFCVGEPPTGMTHVHVVADLEGGVRLWFRDPRRFGMMILSVDDADLGTLGVEPLSEAFDDEFLWRETRRHRRLSVKTLLMDARVVVGVGNIYANEALFDAGIRPTRRCGRLSRADVGRLVAAVRAVLDRAIANRGTSLLDYRDADGNQGDFQRSLRVYERDGESCRRCGRTIRRCVIAARGTFYCPDCQR